MTPDPHSRIGSAVSSLIELAITFTTAAVLIGCVSGAVFSAVTIWRAMNK